MTVCIHTGDYGVPNCELQSQGRNMSIQMITDGFTEAPGFRAEMIAKMGNMSMKPPKDSEILCLCTCV